MTVRLTPSESDSSPSAPVAAPPTSSELQVTTPASAPASAPDASTQDAQDTPDTERVGPGAVEPWATVAPGPGTAPPGLADIDPVDAAPPVPGPVTPDSRVTLREARRARRRTAWLCAAVVALALALTIVVVSLARSRPVPQSSAPMGTPVTARMLAAHPPVRPAPPVPFPGAHAPEGGTP
jgi:hypothetical protein